MMFRKDEWPNRETALIDCWIDSDKALQEDCMAIARRATASSPMLVGAAIQDLITDFLEQTEQWPGRGLIADMLNAAFDNVYWNEIGAHWLDESMKAALWGTET